MSFLTKEGILTTYAYIHLMTGGRGGLQEDVVSCSVAEALQLNRIAGMFDGIKSIMNRRAIWKPYVNNGFAAQKKLAIRGTPEQFRQKFRLGENISVDHVNWESSELLRHMSLRDCAKLPLEDHERAGNMTILKKGPRFCVTQVQHDGEDPCASFWYQGEPFKAGQTVLWNYKRAKNGWGTRKAIKQEHGGGYAVDETLYRWDPYQLFFGPAEVIRIDRKTGAYPKAFMSAVKQSGIDAGIVCELTRESVVAEMKKE